METVAAAQVLASEREATVERRRALRAELAAIVAASVDANLDDEHDPEGATVAFERERTAWLLAGAEAHLADIVTAEVRLAEGTYGICARCGRSIADERLRARPTARTCISCA